MLQKWKRISKLVDPSKTEIWWLSSHAGGTCALKRDDSDFYDIYISGRDKQNRSRIGHAIWSIKEPDKLQKIDKDPCLELGSIGSFSENGTSYPYVLKYEKKYYMFFTGWKLGKTVPFYNNLGLAISDRPEGPFKYLSKAPIFSLSNNDPYGIGSCFVKYSKIDSKFILYYTSFRGFKKKNKTVLLRYCIKSTKSDLIDKWEGKTNFVIKNSSDDNDIICKPTIVDDEMLYCQRSNDSSYKIYYANFRNNKWHPRQKPIELIGPTDNWDKYEQCYPFMIKSGSSTYLIYSGNNYGKGGLGIAKKIKSDEF